VTTRNPRVAIAMGSKSDLPVMEGAAKVLDELGIAYEIRILSAHRTPAEADAWASGAAGRGVGVLICGAGMAAHLAGAVAGRTWLPVIGVPLDASFGGLDSLLATVQMPPGVPVATVAVGAAGAKNAGWLAARILAVGDPTVRAAVEAAQGKMREAVLEAYRAVVSGR
jgi:phosphoribosylaminoimidazole carboxylase PurE protein